MSPARTIKITLQNSTNVGFTFDRQVLSHGIWSQNLGPAESVDPGSSVWFQCESSGVMTGAQGYVTYNAGSHGQFRLNFNNPFAGSNSYSETIPGGLKSDRSGGGGDDASVTWTIFS